MLQFVFVGVLNEHLKHVETESEETIRGKQEFLGRK